jgi:hypothetical protein
MLFKSKSTVGPQLSKGVILLTFFEKRENKALFGFIRSEEKVCFEQWKIPVVLDEKEIPRQSFSLSPKYAMSVEYERQNIFNHARNQVQQRILSILEV